MIKNYVQCAKCGLPIKLTFQQRREKKPFINITCENRECTACGYTITLTDESEFPEYPQRLAEKIEQDKAWIERCKGD